MLNFCFGFRSRPEPGYLAGAVAVTLARLHLKYLFKNLTSLDVFSKVNINQDLLLCTGTGTCVRTYFRQFVVIFKNSKIIFSFTSRSRLRVKNSRSKSRPQNRPAPKPCQSVEFFFLFLTMRIRIRTQKQGRIWIHQIAENKSNLDPDPQHGGILFHITVIRPLSPFFGYHIFPSSEIK